MVKLKFLEQIKFKIQGRAVPMIRALDVETDGRINTLQLAGMVKKRENSLLSTWDNKASEIENGQRMITVIDEKGNSQMAYIVHEGHTCNIYTEPDKFPDREGIIGTAATMDDLRDAMDLAPSMRDKLVYLGLGLLLGWMILAPILNGIMS